ncbi:UNVERIFIED_CONTAM: hypothetical protein GTU68_029397 [Idotea baltica]|nr:hypothetical protein [Idotea baltica]
MARPVSEKLFAQAKRLFPGGVNSPVRAFKAVGGSPIFMESAEGAYLTDVDGNEYIDFCCSWGPLILGHCSAPVNAKIIEAVKKGSTFGTPSRYGSMLGALICGHHKGIEKIRFVSSGTEAVMSAVRLARAYTNRSKLVKFEGCYHGHVDHLLVKAGSGLATFAESSSAGVPQSFANETLVLPLNDLDALEKCFSENGKEIAAVIIEPIPANNGLLLQDKSFLERLQSICKEHGALLIFDEVISGFRVGFEGASGLYNIYPDIYTFGKIIGGGMPVGAFGASGEIMATVSPDGPMYQAGTLSANPVAMAAGAAALTECLTPGFYDILERRTKNFIGPINQKAIDNAWPFKMVQQGSIFWFQFADSNLQIKSADQIEGESMSHFAKLFFYLIENGVYVGPSGYEVGFVSMAHDEKILQTAQEKIIEGLEVVFK